MNRIKINVPYGIRYLSEWKDFRFSNFPDKCIINKQIPGCGFTEFVINGEFNACLISPRKLLIKNKYNQHEDDVYLVVNEMENDPGVDKDLSREPKEMSAKLTTSEEEKLQDDLIKQKNSEIYNRIFQDIKNYYEFCLVNGKYMKILVTYDSYHVVQSILITLGIYRSFFNIIDEFQSILHDSRFKSSTELQFLNILKKSENAYFVSATPMMEEYLDMLKDFKDLPYFELDWAAEDPSRVIKPKLDVFVMRSATEKASEVIKDFLLGNYEERTVLRKGIPVKIISNEIVLYLNSVNHIITIIRRLDLKPEQVNIICAVTEENKKKIRKKLGKKFTIGEIPKKGELHKPITFCTRTSYLGADFYSTCARTFIFSDSNVDSLAVDISEDLPQILGRQRLDENPWSHSATFFYRATADYRKMTQEDFNKIIEAKSAETRNLLSIYFNNTKNGSEKYSLGKAYKFIASKGNYKENYVGVNLVHTPGNESEVMLIPTVNELVLVNEIRAFRIQQIDYKDRFTVFNTINNKINNGNLDSLSEEVCKFMEKYDSLSTIFDKLKLLCESDLSKEAVELFLAQVPDSDEIKSYYIALGPERLKSLGYNVTRIRKDLNIITFNADDLKTRIYSEFKIGDRILVSDVKLRLEKIYNELNYKATAKATDLKNYFEIKESGMRVKINEEKKISRFYELLKKKGE